MSVTNIKRDYWPTEKWQNIEPKKVGIDDEKFLKLEQIINSQYRNINGIIIVRRGYKVFEKYFNGYNHQDTHNVASVTKSFISTLIGIAIDKGYIKDVDQKVISYFPEYIFELSEIKKRGITIRHLLNMTAPFLLKAVGMRYEPLNRLRIQKDWVNYILNLMGKNGKIGDFQYCTAGTHLLSAIITNTTGMSAREFANKYLFKAIGISEIADYTMESFGLDDVFGKNVKGWIKDPKGITIGGWGLTITIRDMARMGFLYLNRGTWNNKQIVSKKWIEESMNINSNNYNNLWWQKKDKDIYSYSALGAGGNVICYIPEKDLVVAIASKIVSKPRDRWMLFEKCIIPSVLRNS